MPRGWRGCQRCAVFRLDAGVRAERSNARRAGVDDIEPLHRLAERAVRVAEEHDVRPGEVGRVEQCVERILHAVSVSVREEELHAVERELQHLGVDRLDHLLRVLVDVEEHDDAAQDADLRRGKADAAGLFQCFRHVVEQFVESVVEFRHRAADLGKAGVAHFMDLANSHNVVLFSLL